MKGLDMKKCINFLCVLFVTQSLVAQEQPKRKLTEQQRIERRAMMAAKRAEKIAAAGGIIIMHE